MAPRLPMPRITLKRRPSSRNDSPGLSSVPPSSEPIITLEAPAARAFTTSPEYLIPPSTVLVLVGVGMLAALEDVLHRDEAPQDAVLVHHRELLDAVRAEDPLRLVERGALGRRDQAVLRHGVADRAVQLPLELQVAVRDDPDQLPRPIDDRHARDLEPGHQLVGLAQRAVRAQRDGIEDHPRLAALDAVHLRRLAVDGPVLVQHADAARPRHRHGHLRLRDGVHRGGDEWDVEGDAAGELAAHVHVPRVHAGVARGEQHIVEGEGDGGTEGSHGESYAEGGVSSTFAGSPFFSSACFAASSTAALPAAANRSKNFPALPTASMVPLMMLTGTRPARIVSSNVSAPFWNGAAPAGRPAYFDSRNST